MGDDTAALLKSSPSSFSCLCSTFQRFSDRILARARQITPVTSTILFAFTATTLSTVVILWKAMMRRFSLRKRSRLEQDADFKVEHEKKRKLYRSARDEFQANKEAMRELKVWKEQKGMGMGGGWKEL